MSNRGVNKVIIIGSLGQDPEVRYMPNGNAVGNISIATSESWKDQQGQKQEKTEWHQVVMFKKLAEIAGEYLHKGSKVYIEGKLQTRKWQDQQGNDRYTTEIVANEMQMLSSRGGQLSGNPGQFNQQQQIGAQQGFNQQRSQQQSTQQQSRPQQSQQQPTYNEPPMDFDDDIPF